MSRSIHDITLYYPPHQEGDKLFTQRQNLVSDLYVQYLNRYKPPKTSRISVHLSDNDKVGGYFGSILSASVKFDIKKFWESSDIEKNRNILDAVHRISMLCAKEFDWDIKPFKIAYEKVIETNFVYGFESSIKLSRDKKHKASVLLEKDLEKSTISVVFYNSNNEKLKCVKILDSFQHIMFYGQLLNKHKWFNNEEFGLYTKGEELKIYASLKDDEPKTIIQPKNSDKDELEGYLRRITYRRLENENDIIKWMNH